MEKIKLKVTLNGTDSNWMAENLGLKFNPFPQMGRAEYDPADRALNSLGGDPIPNIEYIKETLTPYWNDQFIDFICSKFEKGKMVRFEVTIHLDRLQQQR